MKKLLGIVVLGLLLGSKVYSDDVIGTKIVCAERWLQGTEISTSKLPIDGYDFISKNKVIVKQGQNTLLAELVIDENVSDDCVYIINSNKEHYDLGKQYQTIRIENV